MTQFFLNKYLNNKKGLIVLFVIFSYLNMATVNIGDTLTLDGNFNARLNAQFRLQDNNIKFIIPKGTTLKILDKKALSSGNYGFKVQVESGNNKNQEAWVYYNVTNPQMTLNSPAPAAATLGVTTQRTPGLDMAPTGSDEIALDRVIKNLNEVGEGLNPKNHLVSVPLPTREITPAEGVTTAVAICPSGSCSVLNADNRAALDEISYHLGTIPAAQQIAVGARQTMAVMYQSCSVLTKPPYNPKVDNKLRPPLRFNRDTKKRSFATNSLSELVSKHFYLKDLPPRGPRCQDVKKSPPLFQVGGRAQYKGREINILGNFKMGSNRVTNLDCSGFFSVALSAAGLKLKPQVQNPSQNEITSVGLTHLNSTNSCFFRPSFSKKQSLQMGDVIAYPGHVLMIDKVGPDPLGIQQLKNQGLFPKSSQGCFSAKIRADLFNFNIIQSSGWGDMPGVIMEAKNYLYSSKQSGELHRVAKRLFEVACLAEFENNNNPVSFGDRTTGKITLLRHMGESRQDCVFQKDQKPILKGQDCTDGCLREALYVDQ